MAERLARTGAASAGLRRAPPAPPGTAEGFNKWPQRVFLPTVRGVGLDHARPYGLHRSFASLPLHEVRNVIYVARRVGHGADLTLGTYGHTVEELDEAPRLRPDEAIAAARAKISVPV